MNVIREVALERLFRWFQSQTRSPDPSPLLPQALATLQERPVLLKYLFLNFCVLESNSILLIEINNGQKFRMIKFL